MIYDHLPAKFAWVPYKFKLWPGMRYGLVTLATPLHVAQELLRGVERSMILFLGVNRNIKRGWTTLSRAFRGMGLLSFPVEQMICWMNMIVQHFGVPSILLAKSLEQHWKPFSSRLDHLETYCSLHMPSCMTLSHLAGSKHSGGDWNTVGMTYILIILTSSFPEKVIC